MSDSVQIGKNTCGAECGDWPDDCVLKPTGECRDDSGDASCPLTRFSIGNGDTP